MWTDIRSAARLFARSRAFTLTALLSLALGIGASATTFAIARGVLWKPLPFAAAGRLVVVWESDARHGFTNRNEASFADFLEWRDRADAFDHLTALAYRSLNLTGAGEPERLQVAAPSVDFFEMLGVRPILGRTFAPDEEQPSAPPTVILGHGFWTRRFGGDRTIVGRTILLSGTPTTVIGVLPADFRFEFPTRRDIDVWVPRVVTPQARASWRSRGLYVVGRLRSDVSIDAAQARIAAIAARLAAEHPQTNDGWSVRLVPLREQIAGAAVTPLVVLLAAGACLLLIVCANLGTLLLARASSRQGEMAVRAAIGASRARLMGQLFVESLMLASAGGWLASLGTMWTLRALSAGRLAVDLPRLAELHVEATLIAVITAITLASAIAVTLVAARQALAPDLTSAVRGTGVRQTGSAARHTMLAAAEVAIAVMLSIAGGLLFKSVGRLERVDPGFDPSGVLTFQLSLPGTYADPKQVAQFYDTLVARLEALSGVQAAGAVTNLPLAGSNGTSGFSVEGRIDAPARLPELDYRAATPGYFAALGMHTIRGRVFDVRDHADAPAVAVINDAAAREFWPDEDPVGRRIKFGRAGDPIPWTTIVGVVGNVHHATLASPPSPEVYVPQSQSPNTFMYVAVRSTVPDAALMRAAGEQVRALDSALPIFKVQPLTGIVDAALAGPRLSAQLIGLFALCAAVLAIGGTYGLVSYAMSRRTREIGLRVALGAQRRDVMRLVMRGGVAAAGCGAALGTLAALGAMRGLRAMLFGVTAHDPTIFALAPAVLIAAALAACAVPAWRATRMDPASALRARE